MDDAAGAVGHREDRVPVERCLIGVENAEQARYLKVCGLQITQPAIPLRRTLTAEHARDGKSRLGSLEVRDDATCADIGLIGRFLTRFDDDALRHFHLCGMRLRGRRLRPSMPSKSNPCDDQNWSGPGSDLFHLLRGDGGGRFEVRQAYGDWSSYPLGRSPYAMVKNGIVHISS